MTTNSPRITARVNADTQALLSQAAGIVGMSSINSFVLNAAIEKAKKIIERERFLKLSQRDAIMLVQSLDAPAKPNVRLQQAALRYKDKKQ
ncbi:Uncharacterized conserved protein, DUF1778 family [Desulfocicer vacuolatum DSM 3385]|uniref:Uncharacterized conserved protein, DUF1778 family n=1 Tax=Desulfocicer vacuolatum DSM 3385 TaxID=1121400 RepID=A0A1W2ES82_9BACT|nr:DUF1778 domain-containing protein [Desulfocicer vacuolatum]SMD12521.1 Uncharacterized conserved protein, DUF1778 family [Desulfocicer vacuolatum DSM 3385]